MVNATLPTAGALLSGLLAVAPAWSGAPDTGSFVRKVLDGLGAQVIDCPAYSVPPAREHICAKGATNLHAFRKAWSDHLSHGDAAAALAKPASDWIMGWGACRYRDYRVKGVGLRVTLDHQASIVSIVYGDRAEPAAIPRGGSDGVTEPTVVKRTEPVYPREARKNKIHGHVRLEIVVHRDGSVGDVALVWACPEGWGLEDAAAEAVRRWRFDPALRKGEPVEALTTVTIGFRDKAKNKNKYPPAPRPQEGVLETRRAHSRKRTRL